jgi:hypothetical protein
MEIKERPQIRLPALKEPAQFKREHPGKHQENHDEHERHRRREVAAKLTLEDCMPTSQANLLPK